MPAKMNLLVGHVVTANSLLYTTCAIISFKGLCMILKTYEAPSEPPNCTEQYSQCWILGPTRLISSPLALS